MLAGLALVVYAGEIRSALRDSITYCLTVLVPALFPFMAVTGLAVSSGAGEALGAWLGFFTRRLYRLPPCCGAVILMGCIGGYPAGAKGVSLLLEQGKIDREQAGRMLLFCVDPGIAFVVTFVGATVLGSARTGWLLFAAVTLAGLLLGIVAGIGKPLPPKTRARSITPPAGVLIGSVTGACRSVLLMCGCIAAFACFSAILRGCGLFQWIAARLAATGLFTSTESAALCAFLLEVTGGVGAAAELRAGPALYAFGLAFGGLCVHMQVFALFRELPVRRGKFFLFRFLHGGLAAGIFLLLHRLLPGAQEAALQASALPGGVALSGTWMGGLSLLLMCVAFLLAAGGDASSPPA